MRIGAGCVVFRAASPREAPAPLEGAPPRSTEAAATIASGSSRRSDAARVREELRRPEESRSAGTDFAVFFTDRRCDIRRSDGDSRKTCCPHEGSRSFSWKGAALSRAAASSLGKAAALTRGAAFPDEKAAALGRGAASSLGRGAVTLGIVVALGRGAAFPDEKAAALGRGAAFSDEKAAALGRGAGFWRVTGALPRDKAAPLTRAAGVALGEAARRAMTGGLRLRAVPSGSTARPAARPPRTRPGRARPGVRRTRGRPGRSRGESPREGTDWPPAEHASTATWESDARVARVVAEPDGWARGHPTRSRRAPSGRAAQPRVDARGDAAAVGDGPHDERLPARRVARRRRRPARSSLRSRPSARCRARRARARAARRSRAAPAPRSPSPGAPARTGRDSSVPGSGLILPPSSTARCASSADDAAALAAERARRHRPVARRRPPPASVDVRRTSGHSGHGLRRQAHERGLRHQLELRSRSPRPGARPSRRSPIPCRRRR